MSDYLAVADSRDEAIRKAREEARKRQKERVQSQLRERVRILRAMDDPETRALEKEACDRNPIHFINRWVWAYNPWNADGALPTKVPFVLRPRQREMVEWLERLSSDQENGLIEKSRREGASYLCLAFGLHHWLFREGFSMTVGSRKFELVEKKGDLDALIPKVRYMLYRLPDWMRPKDFTPDEHDNEARLLNPEKGSSITGEAGENMGRGGRSSLYLIDEWAHVKRQEMVNAAVSDNAKVHVKLSTPSGSGDKMQEEKRSGRYSVFQLHWQDNPIKNYKAGIKSEGGVETIYPWYERQKDQKDPVTVAQEIDIDYGAAAENVIIPSEVVRPAVEADLPRGAVRTAGLDVASSGDKSILAVRAGPVVLAVKSVGGKRVHQVDLVREICNEAGVSSLYYDRMGVGAQITATLKQEEDNLPFEVVGVTNSDRPTNRKFRDRPEVPADERFKNYAAELWWALRLRFVATKERKEDVEQHSTSDCIAIPEVTDLISQVSQPTYTLTGSGKIKVDKFGQGSSSPDYAEALMYAFAERAGVGFDAAQTVHANVN